MTVTLEQMRTEIQQRLGDSSAQIWTGEEINRYIQEGYDELTKRTGCLFTTSMLPDYAMSFSFTQEWEREFIEDPGYANGPAQFTSEFERDLIDNARGPANHTQNWEFNQGFVSITEVSALIDLPEDLQDIERSTWNTRRIEPLRSRDLEWDDSRYELNKGQVDAYVQDKDGINVLRKWKVPSVAYVPYTFDAESDDGFGIIRDLRGVLDGITVVSTESDGYGDLVQVDGVNVFEDYGILGPIYKETNDLRIEYRRRGLPLSTHQDFEIPDRYTVYVRHFAQSRCLEREGSGQELKLAAHYRARFEAGAARMLKRKAAMHYQRTYVMGGSATGRSGAKKPLARLPWQFGRVVR